MKQLGNILLEEINGCSSVYRSPRVYLLTLIFQEMRRVKPSRRQREKEMQQSVNFLLLAVIRGQLLLQASILSREVNALHSIPNNA